VTGCVFAAKQSLPRNYLREAEEAGTTVFTGYEARGIRTLGDAGRWTHFGSIRSLPYRYEVECKGPAREVSRFRTRLVIVAAGTVGSAELLLRSDRELPNLSRHVGRNLAFNPSVKVCGLLPPDFPEGDMFVGRSHPGVMSYQFLNSHGIMMTAAKPLPLQAVASARLTFRDEGRNASYWGEQNVELMREYRRRVMVLAAFGITPPGGRIRVRSSRKTELQFKPTESHRRFYKDTQRILESVLTRNGCRLIDIAFVDQEGNPHENLHFSTAHQMGSCRMADTAEDGVVDARGEVFGYPGLYVSDGATIPAATLVNPALTILANAERIADGILSRHPASEIVVGHS
jgi:cholesterol oxidase